MENKFSSHQNTEKIGVCYPMPHSWYVAMTGQFKDYPFGAIARCSICGMFENERAERAYYSEIKIIKE
jgi:hypothetical protein